MKLTLSINSLIADILADSALAAVLDRRAPRLFNPDHADALRRTVIHAVALVASSMSVRLSGVVFPAVDVDPSDEISVDIDISGSPLTPEALRLQFVNAVVFTVLHLAAIADDDSARARSYLELSRRAVDDLCSALFGISACPRILPHPY